MLFSLGFAGATALLVYGFGGISVPLTLLSFFLLALSLLLCRRRRRALPIVLLGFCLGLSFCTARTGVTLAAAKRICGREVAFTATALEAPTSTPFGAKATVRLDLPGQDLDAVLYFDKADLSLRPGDTVTGTAKFTQTAYDFSQKQDVYYASVGVTLTGNVSGETVTQVEQPSLSNTMKRINTLLAEKCRELFPESSAGYFTALVTGDRDDLSYGLRNKLSICGLYHAVSLSGMHVSILMGFLLLLIGQNRKRRALLGIPMLLLFLLVCGGSSATARAVFMHILLLSASLVRREYDPLTALSGALLLLLLENPYCIAQWGLQLSFLSTAGILLCVPRILEAYEKRCRLRGLRRKITDYVVAAFSVTLSATCFSLPVMALNFGVVSLIAPLTNLLALPAFSASFLGGIILVLLSFPLSGLAAFLAGFWHCLFVYLDWLLEVFYKLPLAAVYDTQPLMLLWSALWYGLLLFFFLGKLSWRILPLTALPSFLLCACLTFLPMERRGFTALNVGQGQCLVLMSGEETYLIDCGGAGEESGEIAARHLLERGITHVDGLILTHFDSDHTNGVAHLSTRIAVENLYYPANIQPDESLLQIVQTRGAVLTPVSTQRELPFAGDSITLLPMPPAEDENDSGLCILAETAKYDILVTGDITHSAELTLLEQYTLPDVEILVAGHHGSGTSTSHALLDAVSPELVFISVGENSYGHPNKETLYRIHRIGAEVYTTLENRNLTVRW